MRSFLNINPKELSTLVEVQNAGYAFKDNESVARFIKEKMKKPSSIMTWEYKVLVALIFTEIYKQKANDDKKEFLKFEKALFAKSGDKESAAKIFVETWRREAIDVIQRFDRISGHGGPEHPLEATLVVELLIEICIFCKNVKVLKNKTRLEKMKQNFDIAFIEGIAEVRIFIVSFHSILLRSSRTFEDKGGSSEA